MPSPSFLRNPPPPTTTLASPPPAPVLVQANFARDSGGSQAIGPPFRAFNQRVILSQTLLESSIAQNHHGCTPLPPTQLCSQPPSLEQKAAAHTLHQSPGPTVPPEFSRRHNICHGVRGPASINGRRQGETALPAQLRLYRPPPPQAAAARLPGHERSEAPCRGALGCGKHCSHTSRLVALSSNSGATGRREDSRIGSTRTGNSVLDRSIPQTDKLEGAWTATSGLSSATSTITSS